MRVCLAVLLSLLALPVSAALAAGLPAVADDSGLAVAGLGGAVVGGAALVPWTFGLSLPAFGLVDLWLYRKLKDAVVCYRCDTVYRDAVPGPRQGDFDLLKHDVLKYGKTWSEE